MTELPYLKEVFDLLKRGSHLSPEDEPYFSALAPRWEEYRDYFAPLGLALVRHERDFFYFEPDHPESVPATLPRVAIFSYILIDHAANEGRSVEEFILGQNFLVTALPHFSLDRYIELLRQVEVFDEADLRNVLNNLERAGWLKWLGTDEFRFLRPFHRVFSKCLELSSLAAANVAGAAAAPQS
jgi:hypothetical protein